MLATYCQTVLLTFRWEGMAASTNCSSHDTTLRTYLSQLLIHWEQSEQRSKVTEERHSNCPAVGNHVAYAHAPDITRARACAIDGKLAFSLAISLERSRFRKIATLKSMFSLFKSRWCHSFACSERTRADRQTCRETERPSTVTLAAHAHRGLTIA